MKHPSFETLLTYQDGTLTGEEHSAVEAHLNQPCARCQARVQRLGELLQLMATDKTVAPPPPVLRRLVSVFRRLTPNRPRLPIRLVFDSWQHAPLAATRGGSQTQQLLFSAEGWDIDLQISANAGLVSLQGQILGNESLDAQPVPQVLLRSGEALVATTETDRLGQFTFPALPFGAYALHIELENSEIAIEDLHFGQ
jgi:hypothetical protein